MHTSPAFGDSSDMHIVENTKFIPTRFRETGRKCRKVILWCALLTCAAASANNFSNYNVRIFCLSCNVKRFKKQNTNYAEKAETSVVSIVFKVLCYPPRYIFLFILFVIVRLTTMTS